MVKTIPELSISPDKVCFLIVKAREFESEDVIADDEDESPNAPADPIASAGEYRESDPIQEELTGFIDALSEDEQVDLVALAWVGRGDGTLEDWDELRAEAARAHNKRTAPYLLGMPLLPDYLAEALSQFGHSFEDYES